MHRRYEGGVGFVVVLFVFLFMFSADVLAAGPSLGESERQPKNTKNQPLRQEIIELIENERNCEASGAHKIFEKYIKVGDTVSKARKVLSDNGFRVRRSMVNPMELEVDHWFPPEQLKRKKDLPFVAGTRLLITIVRSGAASGKNDYVLSVSDSVHPCAVLGNIISEHADEQTLRNELLAIAKKTSKCGLIDVREVLKKYVKAGDKMARLEKFFAVNEFERLDEKRMRLLYTLSQEEGWIKSSYPIMLWSRIKVIVSHDINVVSVDGYIHHCLKRK